MATVSIVETGVMGDMKYSIADYTGPVSYVTGGDPLTNANLGLPDSATIYTIQIQHADATAADLRLYSYVPATKTVMIFTDIDTITQAGNGTDQSAVTARLFVLAR
jgi:hypothetical protein